MKISQAVENQVMSPPLQAKLWVEKESEQLLVTLEYHYGDFMINPFQNTDEKPKFILVRDMEKEAIIMDIIEHAPINIYKNQLYLQQDEEAMFEFLFRILPQLEELVDIRISEEAKQETLYDASNLITSIDLEQQNNLLEINFDLAGIDEKTVQEVLRSVLEKKKYYRLNNGAFLSLEQDGFQRIQDLFTELNVKKEELEENRLHVPLYKGMQVEEILGQSQEAKGRLSEAFQTLVKRIGAPDQSNWRIPSGLHAELRDYQYTGFRWFKSLSTYSLGGILADDMGLGKTLQTIAYLLSEKEQDAVLHPSLIVVPASLVYNWKNEFEKFAPSLKVHTIAGTPKERNDLLQENADIFITSYPTLRQDMSLYKEREFHALILDEAQTIKNYATKAAAAVRAISAPKRFALSGTPIENSLEELWSIFQTILPGLLPSQQGFKKMTSERISKLVRPFILRRVKKDVLKELPDKIETTQRSELSKEQKELYVGYLEQLKSSLTTEDFQRNRMKILAGLTRLRQICCHPALFIENYEAESSKLEQLLETVHQALANGKRMLIFSQFTSMLHIIREKLAEQNISFFYLDDQTDGKDRVEMVPTVLIKASMIFF
ncbi:DEAD/DEAH box helicase [Priestia flexa]|nr:DEAD/DEAH box helicase [Priestia flexa]